MSKLLRYFAPGQYCFVTSVTQNRQPILVQNERLLHRAVVRAKLKSRFTVLAWVVLPDHCHAVLYTPGDDTAKIMQRIKLSFALQYRNGSGAANRRVRLRTRPADGVWQHRYWDHIIRTDEDLRRHMDYIHFNPVKHGLAVRPETWELSSFRRYLRRGYYELGWGHRADTCLGLQVGE
ncbi:MAG: transposase [bacterium]|nr:transposase [bacterium]